MKYYRYTRTARPMSDWGHAMFSEKEYNFLSHSYDWQHIVDSADLTPITDLSDAIRDAWAEDLENGFGAYISDKQYLSTLDVEDVISCYNPSDICDSAQAYDDGDMTVWLWERILEPRGIVAVSTDDGAVVFDPALIRTQRNPHTEAA
ncbi:MAG TPA: hypothetical protein PKN45_11770 [Candidatus Limiplasma sp.]|nr:hypothetical protein [Candidatus Limiplasma sp.]